MLKLAKDSFDIGLVVSDVDASFEFYCGLLGFPRGESLAIPGNRTLHHIYIGSSVLKLQELHDGPPEPGPHGLIAQVGIRYVTIWIHDIEDVVARLEEAGCTFVLPLNTTPRGALMTMVADPDGNIVELVEPPAGWSFEPTFADDHDKNGQ